MSTVELRKQLIEKIRKIENEDLLKEVNRLIQAEASDIEIYKVNTSQKSFISEAQEQIKKGQSLSNTKANKEIDEWLKK